MYLPENHTLIGAHYVDEARTIVETNWRGDEDGLYRTYTYDATEDNPAWVELLKIMPEDVIHANTYEYIIKSREIFEKAMLEVGKEAGEIEDISKMKDAQLVDHFMGIINRNDQKLLFKIKTKMFTDGTVTKLNNIDDLKEELRTASSLAEALGIYGKIQAKWNK